MPRGIVVLGISLLLLTSFGCAMCCGPDDYAYSAYGGIWQRQDRMHGRVGSLFTHMVGFGAGTEDGVDPEDHEQLESYEEDFEEVPPVPASMN